MTNAVSQIYHAAKLAFLSPLSLKVVKDKLTYLNFEKLDRIRIALARTRDLQGDLLEFGVALGGSAILMAKKRGDGRHFVGFDVFGQIPPPESEKDDAKSIERYETIASGDSKGIRGDEYYGYKSDLFDEVRASFARYGIVVDGVGVTLHQGLFENTLPGAGIKSIAVAHIDCDWYDPVALCLDYSASKMLPGGIIIIDDYHDYGGCRTAVDEFLAAHSEFRFEPGRNPFLVRNS